MENLLTQVLEKQKDLILMIDNIIVKKVIEEIDHTKLKDIPDFVMEASQLRTINQMRLENINEVLSIGKSFITTKDKIDNTLWRTN